MIKRILSITALSMLVALGTQAQSKNDAATAKEETKVEKFTAEEEDKEKKKILSYEKKVMANKDNEAIDFEAEMKRIAEMKKRFNERASTKLD